MTLNPMAPPRLYTIRNPQPRRQIFEGLGIKQLKSPPTLLDEAAIKRTPEPSKPSRFTTFDQACRYPEAKQSLHHGQAGPVRMVKVGGMAFFPKNDASAFKPKAVLSNALEPSAAAPETASTAEAFGPEPPCAAVSQAVMKPKSYAAIAKASVVTTAPPQPAAVPKPKLSTAASMPSTDSKPSATTSELTAHSTSLKVNICLCISLHTSAYACTCTCACTHVHVQCGACACAVCMCSVQCARMCMHVCMCVCMCMCMHVHVQVRCMRMGTCITHAHAHAHACIWMDRQIDAR